MIELGRYEVWFVTGSQRLYGEGVLEEVQSHAMAIGQHLAHRAELPVGVVVKPVLAEREAIGRLIDEANASDRCVGLIAWMHTFSPARMWISGLVALRRPLLHLHTQFNADLPWAEIDMDFMNLNQAAHGDREFGYLAARLRIDRHVVVGHWSDPAVVADIGRWTRAASARRDWETGRIVRFGDNMRDVAVTEGDKVAAEHRLGFSVNTWGVGDLAASIDASSPMDVDRVVEEYADQYLLAPELRVGAERHASLRAAARIEVGLRRVLLETGATAFTDTFEDLHGLEQLPGIAVQRLMAEGYGFGAEGDWKTAAMVRALKVFSSGRNAGTSFMEDYTYHLRDGAELVLGAHMLEVCPSIAAATPRVEIHPLAIGGKGDPVRLVFDAAAGAAVVGCLIDLGSRFRIVSNAVDVVAPPIDPGRLPVARAVWKPRPDFRTSATAWITAGGSHHTALSYGTSIPELDIFARMSGIEHVAIDEATTVDGLRATLRWSDAYFRLADGLA